MYFSSEGKTNVDSLDLPIYHTNKSQALGPVKRQDLVNAAILKKHRKNCEINGIKPFSPQQKKVNLFRVNFSFGFLRP